MSITIITSGCSGCGGVKKGVDETLNTAKITETVNIDSSNNKGEPIINKTQNLEASKLIDNTGFNSTVVDEFNVRKKVLNFKDPKTGTIIKTIDLVEENPFHKMGLQRRKEPYPSINYFLMMPKASTKYEIKKFLPLETFKEIPEDFPVDRAISKVKVSLSGNKYATVSYELDWLPDAYSDDGEWDGPGYGVHYVVVYDSLGNEIFTKQFDGTSQLPSVSHDGKYLFTMACITPEWENNIKYKFTVVNIKTGKVAYTEIFENCQKHRGGGNFYAQFNNSNGYYAVNKNNNIDGFSYENNNLYYFLNENKFKIKIISNEELLLTYPDRKVERVKKDSIYKKLNID